jgi:hypothetical protein
MRDNMPHLHTHWDTDIYCIDLCTSNKGGSNINDKGWVGHDERKQAAAKHVLVEHDKQVMHTKYMHELCSLLMRIPTYYNVISCYNHVL